MAELDMRLKWWSKAEGAEVEVVDSEDDEGAEVDADADEGMGPAPPAAPPPCCL